MKRILVCGMMSLLAASAALQALGDPSPPTDRRPPGMTKPVGPPPRPSPPRPAPPGQGGRPPAPRPPQNGHHHRPPPGGRPGNRPIYGRWNGHRLRLGIFHYPPGYAYRRWTIGQTLPQLLFSTAYYFTDYASLGLDAPPYGYQWVRYGPDVVLVNIRTGEILDVVSGVFY
jgi:Ni/Co efflux regulator RcnB